MSDTVTQAKIELIAKDSASAVVRKLRSEIDKTVKSLERFTNIKIPDALTGALQPVAARQALDAMKAQAETARQRASLDARATRQRRADGRAEATERRMFDRQDVAALREKMGFVSRMGRQRAGEDAAAERQRRTVEVATMRDMRQRVALATRMHRQRLGEAREAERVQAQADARAERDATAVTRRRLAGERQVQAERKRLQRDAVRYGRDSWTRGRDAVREVSRPPAAVAIAGTAAAGAGARRALRAESDIDAAEINARIYGGLSADAARKLRDQWASPLAEALGTGTDKLLTAYTDALKVGIPNAGAQAFSELATKTSEAWSVPFEGVVDILGTVNSILTSKGGPFDFDKLKSVANSIQHLAAKQSTTPEKLMSYLQRGAGAADILGMSQEAGLAFGSASTSLGNQAGQSGRMFDYIASRIIEMPRLTRQHGEEGRQARQLLHALGYGSAEAMDAKRRANPDAFLPDLMDRFNRIKNPKMQEQAIRFFTGREWIGEFGRMVKGIDTYREAVKLAKEAKGLDAIGAVWDLHRLKLGFVFKQFKAGWLNILGEFGKVLSPMARQAGDVFLAWSAKLRAGGLAARFKASIDGFLEGLGFRDLPDMLRRVLGEPGEGGAGAISAWKATFREFGAGIRDVVGSIKAVIGAFTGGNPETIARWTGRILALSAALVLLNPVLTVLRGLISGIIAIASAAASIGAALKLAGIASSTGAAGAIGTGFLAAAGGIIGAALLAAIADKLGILKAPDMSKGWSRGILEFLDPGIASRVYGDRKGEADQAPAWRDPPARVRRQSAGSDWRGLVKPAAFDPSEDIARNTRRMAEAFAASGARLHLANFGASGAAAIRAFPGGNGAGGVSLPGNGGGAAWGGGAKPAVPGWFGRGSGGGATVAQGNLAANQQEAYKAALAEGLSDTAARALVANMSGESLRNPSDHHWDRKHMSQGIVQWDPQRAEAIRRQFGKLPKDMSVSEQTRAAVWEIRNNPRFARTARALQGSDGSAMLDALVRNYEAPADPDRAIAERQRYLNGFKPGETGATATGGQFDGLRVKGGQATAGGGTAQGVIDLARAAQADLPGGVKHFGAFNDRYHQGTGSKHAHGLAFDTSLLDPFKSAEAAEAMRAKLRAAGLADGAFRVIDEYRNPSARSTGGHLHTQFNTAEAAAQYAAFAARTRQVAKVAEDAGATLKRATGLSAGTHEVIDGMRSTGWRRQSRNSFGGVDSLRGDATPGDEVNEQVPNAGDKRTVPLPPRRPGAKGVADGVPLPPRRPTAEDLAGQAQPPRPVRPVGGSGPGAAGAGSASGGTVIHAPVTIHAGQQTPAEIAGHMQRHVAEARNFRSHDLEPELT